MKALTSKQTKELETLAIKEYNIDGLLLMENAARAFTDCLEQEEGSVCKKRIAVFCGGGGNGGDGLAIARHVYNRGADVCIVPAFSPEKLSGDTLKNFDIIARMGIPMLSLQEIAAKSFDLVIDALLGIGVCGELRSPVKECIELIASLKNRGAKVYSVDMPSGAAADDGKIASLCVHADVTVTFTTAKPGQFLYPAKEYVGKLFIQEISIPQNLYRDFPADTFILDDSIFRHFPAREENSHKGSFGKVLMFVGSPGMQGAGIMATEAVLRAGAGTVTVAATKDTAETVVSHLKEAMTLVLPKEGDALAKSAASIIEEKLKSQDVLLAGCGLGQADSVKKTLISLVSACEKPMVIDADGLNALKGNAGVLKGKSIPPVITPHPLEFSRLSGIPLETIQNHKLEIARTFAKENGVVLVLKGADTIIAAPDGKVYINPESNSGLATAGSGDVLSGIIASLLGRSVPPFYAAALGVYIHAKAGLLARTALGASGMIASDVLSQIPHVLMDL